MNYSSAPLTVNGNLYSIVHLQDDTNGTESVHAHDVEGNIVLTVSTADSGSQCVRTVGLTCVGIPHLCEYL